MYFKIEREKKNQSSFYGNALFAKSAWLFAIKVWPVCKWKKTSMVCCLGPWYQADCSGRWPGLPYKKAKSCSICICSAELVRGTLRDWEEEKAKWAVAVAETWGARYFPPSPLSNTFNQKSHSINATSLTFPLEFIFLHFYWHHQGQHLPPFQDSCKTLLIDLPAFSFSTFIRPWTWMPDHLDYEQIKCWNMPILTHC